MKHKEARGRLKAAHKRGLSLKETQRAWGESEKSRQKCKTAEKEPAAKTKALKESVRLS